MTEVYQLMELPEDYRTISLNVMSLASMLDGVSFNDLRKKPTSNISLTPYWNDNIVCSSKEVLGSDTEIADIFLWRRTYLVLSSEAANILAQRLDSKGELLPIRVDSKEMFIFNCLQFGQENLAFQDEDASNKQIFKSNLVGPMLFVTEDFKSLCEEHNLKGLRFERDLLAIF